MQRSQYTGERSSSWVTIQFNSIHLLYLIIFLVLPRWNLNDQAKSWQITVIGFFWVAKNAENCFTVQWDWIIKSSFLNTKMTNSTSSHHCINRFTDSCCSWHLHLTTTIPIQTQVSHRWVQIFSRSHPGSGVLDWVLTWSSWSPRLIGC